MLKLIGLVIPLGLDTFAISAALAMAGLRDRQRLRISVVFTAFEAGMPLIGLAAGHVVSAAAGNLADLAAIALLVGLGLFMVLSRNEDEAEQKLSLLARTHGVAVLGLGISVSLDELAIGFALGLLHAPVPLAVALIATQAFLAAQLGFLIGSRVGSAVREGAEHLAGVILLLLGAGLAIGRLIGVQL